MADGRDEPPSSGTRIANLVVAVLVHVFFGLPWFVAVTGFAWLFGEEGALVWGLCGFVLWTIGLVDALRSSTLGGAWRAVLVSWLWIIGGPLSLAIVGIQRLGSGGEEEEPVNPELERRLDALALQLRALSDELAEIRRLAETGETPTARPVTPQPPAERATDWEPRVPVPPPARPAPPPPPPPKPREPSMWDREIDWADLLGAKGLAWAGGVVTVLGVVFFFVLAVNRGWIGELERVGLGALASLLVFAGGLYLHRRFGPVNSAYGAVGAGLAGGYATLLAAAALYDLLPDVAALAVAAGIACVATATALYWSSELIAGIGLIGATLVPLMVLFEEDISPIGTGFAGLVFAGTAVVAVYKRWPALLAAGFAASLPQIALLVGDGEVTDWDRVILAWVFAALYIAAGHALHRELDDGGLHSLSATFVVVSAVLAGFTGVTLFDGDDRGWIIIGSGLAFAALGAVLLRVPRDRDFSALLGAAGLGLVAVGLAVILTGPSLALAWAAEAAVLAWLAQRIREPRYQLVGLAYLGAATVYAFAIAAPPTDLYDAVANPADGALAPLGVAIAAGIVALYARPWPDESPSGFFRYLEPVLAPFREAHAVWRALTGWLAGLGAIYAASLGILELGHVVWSEPLEVEFERAHVAVTAFWGLTAAALTYASRWLGSFQVRAAGLTLASATFFQAALFDVTFDEQPRGWALLAAAVPILLTAFAEELPPTGTAEITPSALLFTPASAGLAVAGLYFVTDAEGWAWLGLAVVYVALGALVLRADRDFSTALWAPGLAVGVLSSVDLLDRTWLVLAWSGVAAALAVVGDRFEERLQLGAGGYLALALGYTLVELAPPDEFFNASDHPADGVPALLCVVAAFAVFTVIGLRRGVGQPYRVYAAAGTAMLAGYAASLAILGLFEWIGTASVETNFQRGHSAVSAFWGIVGLVTLYVGLSRNLRALRLAGFALFGLALAKLFLYDLANLSSVTRALSFLAVGAVLLLGGFFYQRLTTATRQA